MSEEKIKLNLELKTKYAHFLSDYLEHMVECMENFITSYKIEPGISPAYRMALVAEMGNAELCVRGCLNSMITQADGGKIDPLFKNITLDRFSKNFNNFLEFRLAEIEAGIHKVQTWELKKGK